MTRLLDEALAAVRRMPARDQDEIARALIQMTHKISMDDIVPEHHAARFDGLEQVSRGPSATDEEVAEPFRLWPRGSRL